ncbi:MAG TPA: hypothetical protein VM347_01090 [Nonomuraea sp.]|nr:hypothetical protein [Nonomuraea sp.]
MESESVLHDALPDLHRVAKHILGSTKWDPAKWDRGEVNAGLARLAKLWTKQAALKAKAAAADQAATETATKTAAKTAPARKRSRPNNGSFVRKLAAYGAWGTGQRVRS